MGTMQKLLEISLVHHLKKAMADTSPFQFGFKSGTGTGEAMMRLNNKMKELAQNLDPSGVLFIDFKKAFDSVNRQKLYEKMSKYGIKTEVIGIIKAIHDYSLTEINDKLYKISCGVPQGSPMSPFLLKIYIDDLLISLSNNLAFPITFADDLTATFCGRLHFYSNRKIIDEWCYQNDMTINLKKSNIIFVTKKRFTQGKNSDKFPVTSFYKHLGALINKNGSLTKHIKASFSSHFVFSY